MKLIDKIPKYVLNIINELEDNNYNTYLVGGCVRDLLLNRQPKDYDITTSALPEQIKELFSHVILTGEKHGTVTVVTDMENVEVTTMRKDGIYKDNRHPETVEFTDDIVADLSRRDFKINAIAINNKGEIKDPFNGIYDLKYKLIRAVGNPNLRFNEDALRMMRAVRFACQLDFMINKDTANSMFNNRYLIKNISAERIRDELCKILISNSPALGIDLLRATGLLNIILPEINNMVDFDQYNPNHDKNVYEHTLTVLNRVSNDITVRLSALLHDVGKPLTFFLDENNVGHFYSHHMRGMDIARDILQRLKFDSKTIETVCILVKEHMSRYDFLRTSNIKKFINRVGIDNLDNLFELQIADIKASKPPHDISSVLKLKEEVKKVIDEKQPLTVKDLKINGYVLMELGIKPGREMGILLDEMLELVLENPELNNEGFLVDYAKENLL